MKRIIVLLLALLMIEGCQKISNLSLEIQGYPHYLPPGYSLKCDNDGHYLAVRSGLQISPYWGRYHYSKEAAYIRAWDQYTFENRGIAIPPQNTWPICEVAPKED